MGAIKHNDHNYNAQANNNANRAASSSNQPAQREPKVRQAAHFGGSDSVQLENITHTDGTQTVGRLPFVSKNSSEHVDHFRKVHSFRQSLRQASTHRESVETDVFSVDEVFVTIAPKSNKRFKTHHNGI
jgi:hypothetical protein